MLGAVYIDHGLTRPPALVHRLFDPLIEEAATLGAGLDWKTSLQELTASAGARRAGVRRRGDRPGPRRRSSRAVVRVAGEDYGEGSGRSKKEAEQEAAATAWRRLRAELPDDELPTDDCRALSALPELPEVEVVRRGLARWVGRPHRGAVEVRHPRAVRRHAAGAADFAARLAGRTLAGAQRRGKYLWLPLERSRQRPGEAVLAHLGMSGQLLVRPADAPDETHLRVRLSLRRRRARAALRRPADVRRARRWSTPTRPGVPLPVAHIARDPLDPEFDDEAFAAALRRRRTGLKRALLDQTLVSGIGNIYADEALWRARLHWARPTDDADPGPARRGARRGARGDGRGARPGRHVVRLALRQRQRRERLLRPLAGRLRPDRRAVPPLRGARACASRS